MKKTVKKTNKCLVGTLLCLLLGGLFFCFGSALPQKQPLRPNLLFIMTDQQRFDALSYAGNTILHTPNMDRLAREGAWFENAYTQCAVCVPARSSMLTGHSLANTGVISNRNAYEPEESGLMPMKTYDEILAENGYECEYYGKWHAPVFRARVYKNPVTVAGIHKTELGPGKKEAYLRFIKPHYPDRPLQEGEFKDTLTERPYLPDPIDTRYILRQKGESTDVKIGQSDIHGTTTIPAEYYIAAFEAGAALEALDRLKNKPFSITCSFHHPHPPCLAAGDYTKLYPPEKMVPPVSINDDMVGSPYLNMRKNTDEKYSDPKMIQYFMSEYYALIKEVDDWVGKLLERLNELNLTDNTLVIFTSDHGEMLGSHGMRGKSCFYEESSHVPMIIRFPGRIRPGTTVKAPVSNMNLFATILDYMNQPAHPSDGKSLRGLIDGGVDEEKAYTVTEWLSDPKGKPAHMVVKNGWKLMLPAPSSPHVKKALYNLNNDPYEMTNLLADNMDSEIYNTKVSELENCFGDWMNRINKNKPRQTTSRHE